MSMPATPLSPYLHAPQAYWRNHQWMLSFFRQSSEDKVSSFYPHRKSILGLTAKSHKITSNTTTYSKNLYYGYISLNPYQWSLGGKWFKCYLLRHRRVSTSPQFFFTCQPEPCTLPPARVCRLIAANRRRLAINTNAACKLNGQSKCKQDGGQNCAGVFSALARLLKYSSTLHSSSTTWHKLPLMRRISGGGGWSELKGGEEEKKERRNHAPLVKPGPALEWKKSRYDNEHALYVLYSESARLVS